MCALSYEKVELKKSFNVFHRKLINYTNKDLKNTEEVLILIQYQKGPKSFFNYKNNPKELAADESRS